MKENLIGRIGRIISASFNSLVGAIENTAPEAIMEEAIREIDEAVDEVRNELGKVIANKHLANTRLMEENRKHEDFAEKIELAVSENRDDLAETAISRQLDIEAQIPVLESTIADCNAREKELDGYISALQAKKRQMKEELSQYRKSLEEADQTAPKSDSGPSLSSQTSNKVFRAESAFDRVMEKSTGVPVGTRSENLKEASKMAELEDMARKNRINERLLAIKGKNKG
jgi:phage shock protein A